MCLCLDLCVDRGFFALMQHVLLKSKIHRACVTVADVDYEGSIEIPSDLMEAAGIWEGERVLVTSASKGGRLETYAQAGEPGTGKIIMNGGAARTSLRRVNELRSWPLRFLRTQYYPKKSSVMSSMRSFAESTRQLVELSLMTKFLIKA